MGLKVEQFLWLFCFGFNTNINRFNLQASCRTCGTAEAIKRQRASKWNQIGSMSSVCSVWLQNQPQWIQLETKASCRTCGTAERASKWNTRLLSVMFWFQNQHQSIQLGLLENLWNCGSCEEAMSLKVEQFLCLFWFAFSTNTNGFNRQQKPLAELGELQIHMDQCLLQKLWNCRSVTWASKWKMSSVCSVLVSKPTL